MQFNPYSAYSIISTNEGKNKDDLQKVLNLIDDMCKIKSIKNAKEYLNEEYNIKDSVEKYPLGSKGYLYVNENKEEYSVKIVYEKDDEKECRIYNYKK